MACLPSTPVHGNYRKTSYVTVSGLDVTNSLTTGEAINSVVLAFSGVLDGALQVFRLAQVNLREVASSAANVKKADLVLHLWHGTAPTAPTPNAVYATPVGATYLGCVMITESDYRRLNEETWEAVVYTNDIYISTNNGDTTSIFGVLLSAEASGVGYATSAALSVSLTTQLYNVVTAVQ